jgi:hypothetical protein
MHLLLVSEGDIIFPCSFALERETLSLSFIAVLQINILEDIIWEKGKLVPHLQDIDKSERPLEQSLAKMF